MSTITTVTSALKTQLDAISNTKIKTVLQGRNRKNTGFPYIRFYLDDYENELVAGGGGNASDNWVSVRYRIDIIGELASDKTASKKEDDFQNAVEAVTAKLEEEWKLNTNDVIVDIIGEGAREEQAEEGLVIVLSLIVTIKTFRSYT